jgi:SAM-dependent methyltransferase
VRRTLIDELTRFLGWIHRNQHITDLPAGRPVKVNLGSSLAVAGDWINIDGSLSACFAGTPRPVLRLVYRLASMQAQYSEAEYLGILKGHRFVHHNLEYGIPLPTASADYLYTSHFVEHLAKRDAERLLRDALRVLKPGGVLRVIVPDLAQTIEHYQGGEKEAAVDALFDYQALGYFARHRYMYDFSMLAALLGRIGFTQIERRAFRVGRTPDIAVLDNRPESLFVEAARPNT